MGILGVCLEERWAGTRGVALLSSWPYFQLLRRILFCFSLSLFPEHPDSPSRQALSRQHLHLNDFNELYQFLGCFCCCFRYLCCCCCDFLELSGVAVAEDFRLDILALYFVLGTNWYLCCFLPQGDIIKYFCFSPSLVPVLELAFTGRGLAFC